MGNTCNTKASDYEQKSSSSSSSSPSSLPSSSLRSSSLIHDSSSILSTSCCYNANEKCMYIGTCSDDNRIAVLKNDHHSDAYSVVHYLVGHDKAVNKITMNNDILWSASRDLSLRQWNIRDGQCLLTINKAHELNIVAVVTSIDNGTVYSGSRDYSVKVWDSEKGVCKQQYQVPRNIVTSLEIGKEHLLYQGSEDLCVRVWDTRAPATQPAVHITGYVYFPTSMSLHEDEQLLATGCKGFEGVGCEVKLWDVRNTSKAVTEFIGHTHDVTGCRFTNKKLFRDNCNGSMNQYDSLVTVSKDGSLAAWDYKHIKNDDKNKTTSNIAMLKEGKYYTSLSLLSVDDKGLHMAISAFDGTLSFKTLTYSNSNRYEFIDSH